MQRTFTGFGFGAIQGGLFLQEAWRSGNFSRLVVAEVVPSVVDAVRNHAGCYELNVATPSGITAHRVGPVEILNPLDGRDRAELVAAVAESSEIATALPSVKFYGMGGPGDVQEILAAGLRMKRSDPALPDAVIYTAENNNHAAEILAEALEARLGTGLDAVRTQVLNTVIGKMSGVVGDEVQIAEQGLSSIVPGMSRAFLVEEFNRIFISRITRPGFTRGIAVFEEKDDLLPFEEAKLYGHNATHALLGYLLREKGGVHVSDASDDPQLMQIARDAFLSESGTALCRKYGGIDPLFTNEGYRAYVDDLMIRMVNPHLKDRVDRVTRDTRRKLGWNDRLIGTMRLAMSQGIQPVRYAQGAAAALRCLAVEEGVSPEKILRGLWNDVPEAESSAIRELLS